MTADAALSNETEPEVLRRARRLAAAGDARAAIDLLSDANRRAPDGRVEAALVALRRRHGATAVAAPGPAAERAPLPMPTAEGLVEVAAGDLTTDAVRTGLAQSGCLLVRGLLPRPRAAALVAGIDQAMATYDDATEGVEVDPAWYRPGAIPDWSPNRWPAAARRRFLRERGGLWTVDSPRMLFHLFEVVDDLGLGRLMTEVLGERPVLSASKCTLRRVPPELEVPGGWHQDGAFLGAHVAAFNIWLSLSHCGEDAPGLDLVPRRIERVLPSDDDATYDWSLSERAVLDAAEATPIVRPSFEPGDALLFDQFLVHRTAVSAGMTRPRHAIEAWFFGPSAYPDGQLPLLY